MPKTTKEICRGNEYQSIPFNLDFENNKVWYSQEEVDKLKKALKEKLSPLFASIKDITLKKAEKETSEWLNGVFAKPDNVAYFGVQPREIRELNKESFIKSNIEVNKDVYDSEVLNNE